MTATMTTRPTWEAYSRLSDFTHGMTLGATVGRAFEIARVAQCAGEIASLMMAIDYDGDRVTAALAGFNTAVDDCGVVAPRVAAIVVERLDDFLDGTGVER